MGQRGSTQVQPNPTPATIASAGAAVANATAAQLAAQQRLQQEEIERQRLRALEEEKRNQSRAEIGRLKLILSSVARTQQSIEKDASAFDALLSVLPENDFSTAAIFFSAALLSSKSFFYIVWRLLWLNLGAFLAIILTIKFLTREDVMRMRIFKAVGTSVFVAHCLYFIFISVFDAMIILSAAFLMFSLQDVQSSIAVLRRHGGDRKGWGAGSMATRFTGAIGSGRSSASTPTSSSSSSVASAGADSRTLTDAKYSDISAMLAAGVSVPVDTARDGEDAPVCSICLFNQPDVAFIPCGHVRCCVECVRSLCKGSSASGHKCPECRTSIKQVFYPARR